MVQRRKVELRERRLPAEQLQVRLVVAADGGVGVREVGDLPLERVQFGGHRVEFRLEGLRLLAKLPSLGLPRFPLGGVLRLADRFGNLVRAAVEVLDFGLPRLALCFEGNEAVHVNLGAAVDAILFDEFRVFDDESAIEHGQGLRVRD